MGMSEINIHIPDPPETGWRTHTTECPRVECVFVFIFNAEDVCIFELRLIYTNLQSDAHSSVETNKKDNYTHYRYLFLSGFIHFLLVQFLEKGDKERPK